MPFTDMELYDLCEPFMEIINPLREEQVVQLGDVLKLKDGDRIIDFGCGKAKFMAMWSKAHGITGTGIDVREHSVNTARELLEKEGVADRIDIIQIKGDEHVVEPGSFDIAMCIGASFIWGGFRETLQGMKNAIGPNGRLVIGEPYWIKEPVPEPYLKENPGFFREIDILRIAREEGFDMQYLIRSSEQGWDEYEGGNMLGLTHWLDNNPDHPDRQQVIDWMHKLQDDYLTYGREYLGFAVYVFHRKHEP